MEEEELQLKSKNKQHYTSLVDPQKTKKKQEDAHYPHTKTSRRTINSTYFTYTISI